MAALNKVLLIGNLGADPEVKTLASGDKVANVRLATTETYKNRNGEKVEETEWHRVEFFGRLAEIVEQYVKKGHSIYVEGKIKYRKYTDANNVERYITEIRASNLQMLTRGDAYSTKQDQPVMEVAEDDGLPF